MIKDEKPHYSFTFSRRPLLVNESCQLAELYSELGDWSAVRKRVLETNLLQSRTVSTAKKQTSELISRLKTLTVNQLQLLVNGTPEEKAQILWLALCNRYSFLHDFAVELLREKFLRSDPLLKPEDYEHFFNSKADWHEELDKVNAATKKNIRQTIMQILREAGLLTKEDKVIPANLSSRVVESLGTDSLQLLSIFPVSDAGLRELVR